MIRFKASLLTIGLSVLVLGGILGKLAIGHHTPWQSAEANSRRAEIGSMEIGSTEIGKAQPALGAEISAKAIALNSTKTTLPEAVQIAEAAMGGKAHSIERETEDEKPVIEVGIGDYEVFVDAESSEIVLIDNLRQKADWEDVAQITAALKLQPLAVLTIQQALQAGERFAGKQAHTVTLKKQHGKIGYAVVIDLQEVFVDAGNGQILFTKPVGRVDATDSPRLKGSIQVSTPDR